MACSHYGQIGLIQLQTSKALHCGACDEVWLEDYESADEPPEVRRWREYGEQIIWKVSFPGSRMWYYLFELPTNRRVDEVEWSLPWYSDYPISLLSHPNS